MIIGIGISLSDNDSGDSGLAVSFVNNGGATLGFDNFITSGRSFSGDSNGDASGYCSTQIPDGVTTGQTYRITFDYDYTDVAGGCKVRLTGSPNGITINDYPTLSAGTFSGSYDESVVCSGDDATAYILFSMTSTPAGSISITNFYLYRS